MFPRENDTQFTMASLCFRIENTCTKTHQISLILVVYHKQRVRSMMQERKKQDGIGLPGETNAILQGDGILWSMGRLYGSLE